MGKDQLRYYTVRIETLSTPKVGSGIILIPEKNSFYLYILTAKHVVNDCSTSDIKVEHIDHNGKILVTFIIEKILCVDVEPIRKENDGVSILVVRKNSIKELDYLSKIDVLTVIDDDFEECTVIGYPAIHEGNKEIERYSCKYEDFLGKDGYEVFSTKPLNKHGYFEDDCLQGLSGSGVFIVEQSSKVYLVGIQVQHKVTQNLVCIDLRGVTQKVNERLQKNNLPSIQQNQKLSFDGITIKPTDLDFDLIKEKLEKRVASSEEEIEKLKKEVDSQIKILADSYLSLGINYHKEGDNRKATQRLKSAIKYFPNHSIYLMQAKKLRTKSEDEYIESKISKTNQISENHKLSIIESFVDKYEKNGNSTELEKNYLRILNIYEKNEDKYMDKIRLVYFKLGKLHLKMNYEACENYLCTVLSKNNIDSIRPSSIDIYKIWIEAARYHRKDEFALSLCEKALKLPKNKISDCIKLNIVLMKLTYIVDNKSSKIYIYYQKAKYYLSKIENNPSLHKKLSIKLNRTWFQITFQETNNFLSDINYLKTNADNLTREIIEIKNSIENKKVKADEKTISFRIFFTTLYEKLKKRFEGSVKGDKHES